MKASDQLEIGNVYMRSDLAKLFNITDSTINNGVFKLKGYDSVWLFITEQKGSGGPAYQDLLINNILKMDGQTKGRTDDLIISHIQKGLELLLFYRKKTREGFRYEGKFQYVSHEGSLPTHFILQRENGIEEISNNDLKAIAEEESDGEQLLEGGGKERYIRYYERKPKLRAQAIQYHGTRCMICNFSFEDFYGDQGKDYIEVHHLVPVSSLSEKTKVNPCRDMIVVCSNCHRMIHRQKGKTLSPDELKIIICKN